MNCVVDDHFGGPEVLRVVEGGDSRPGPGEVCVRALTAGVGPGEYCQGDKMAGRSGSAWVGPVDPAWYRAGRHG